MELDISPNFSGWLDDTEVHIVHPRLERVPLSQIYVTPHLRGQHFDLDQIISPLEAVRVLENNEKLLVLGDEQSGKTSLAKFFFRELLQKNLAPLFLKGGDIAKSDFTKPCELAWKSQYENGSPKSDDLPLEAVIIDDFQNVRLNRKYQNEFLRQLAGRFRYVILVAHDSYRLMIPEISELEFYAKYDIQSFGHQKRFELIQKWAALGEEESIAEESLHERVDYLTEHINTFVRKNVVPPKPFYVLTLLQSFEASNPQRLEMTTYGHCYQYLIYQAFTRMRISNSQIDLYMNFLTEFAAFLFFKRILSVNFEQFLREYKSKFLDANFDRIMEDLVTTNILLRLNDELSFKYKFIYYFFAAKYLAENLFEGPTAKEEIRRLIQCLHFDECSNIIVFLTYHTKDGWVLDEIQLGVMELFAEHREAALGKDQLGFLVEFIEKIPEIVLEKRQVAEERKRVLERRDRAEALGNIDLNYPETERGSNGDVYDSDRDEVSEATTEHDIEELGEIRELLVSISKTFQGVAIIGQIVRTRHGSLTKETLKSMILEAYGVGLRFLTCFLEASEAVQKLTH